MSSGIMPFGALPQFAGLSPDDLARLARSQQPASPSPVDGLLFDRAGMGGQGGFSGTSGTIVPPAVAAKPEPETEAPTPRAMPAPPVRPLTFGRLPAAPSATPETPATPATTGTVPAAPTSAAPAATPSASDPSFLDRIGSSLRDVATDRDLLMNLGIGLMSTPGWGQGAAVGLKGYQDSIPKRAAADLARAEYGLKVQKAQQEAGALTGNAAILKKAYPNLSDVEAQAQASNGATVTEALKILRDPNHGRDNDPAVIRAKAQAQAEGSNAGKPDDLKLVDVPQADGTTVKTWLKPGEMTGQPVGAPEQSTTANEAVKQAQRRQGVINSGKDPNDPRYADYILSGSLPKETQQLLTASDKKAIMDGEDTILGHKNTLTQLTRALDLSKKAYDGAGAGIRASIVSNIPEMLGGHTPESLATREFANVVTGQALDNLKATFGGAPTEGERAILLQVQGSADQPQALREQILKNAMAKVQQKLDFEQQRVDQLRGGTYYKQGGGGTAAPAGDGAAPSAPVTGAKRLRFDPKTGGFN